MNLRAMDPSHGPGRSLLYSSPEVYDVAFGWDLSMELDFIEDCFSRHAGTVRRVLEPACGSGRLLASLADRGYEVLGYDVSPEMIAYAAKRLPGGRVLRGDMAGFRPPGTYDAAINLVNSIGYLLEDSAFSSHLARVGASLRAGGVYLIQLSYGGEPLERSRFGPWANRRGDLRTILTWRVAREDPTSRRSYQECRIETVHSARRWTIEETHVLRYWTQEDFDRLVSASPFDLAAVYYDRFEEHPLDLPRTGELGNLYHVLRRRPRAPAGTPTSSGGSPRAPMPGRRA